jgi:hypothetical protein
MELFFQRKKSYEKSEDKINTASGTNSNYNRRIPFNVSWQEKSNDLERVSIRTFVINIKHV